MKQISFNYTDAKGKTSTRDLLVMKEPTDKYSGIDLKELDIDAVPEFVKEMEAAQDAYVKQLELIKEKYDMIHSYRQFFEAKMTDITVVE